MKKPPSQGEAVGKSRSKSCSGVTVHVVIAAVLTPYKILCSTVQYSTVQYRTGQDSIQERRHSPDTDTVAS